jgi:hypothetical protein
MTVDGSRKVPAKCIRRRDRALDSWKIRGSDESLGRFSYLLNNLRRMEFAFHDRLLTGRHTRVQRLPQTPIVERQAGL